MGETIELANKGGVSSHVCPQCNQQGRRVDTQTVKAMLAISLHAVRPDNYYFCQTEWCPVVYFTADGEQHFTEAELREKVYQKHLTDDNVLICYCFQHTPCSMREELHTNGHSTVVETIAAGTQEGRCACDIRNPQGTCCLGNVRHLARQMVKEKR